MKYLLLIFPLCIACASVPVNTQNLDNMAAVIDRLPASPEKPILKKMIETEKKEKTALIKENAVLKEDSKKWHYVRNISMSALLVLVLFFIMRRLLHPLGI